MLTEIIRIAKEAGKIALSADRDRHVMVKEGRANFVTEYDKRVQEHIISELKKLLPDAHFIGEEADYLPEKIESGYTFVIDPIDGTTNFIRGSAFYSICIGLVNANKPVCGVVYIPALDVLYHAEYGKGAYVTRNKTTKEIHVSGNTLDGSVIAMGTSPYEEKLVYKSFVLGEKLMSRAADIRRSGSAAIDICAVAEGVYDIMFEYMLSVWDYTAAAIILSEAGGVFTDLEGDQIKNQIKTPFLCGTPLAHAQAVEFIRTEEI
ncbi:MAG: inositol monophosphatase [Clostridia bacterium]|nr:inositol monophosphatase [Clostridia bacterium]